MSTWLIFGASRATGLHLLNLAIEKKQKILVFVRNKEVANNLNQRGVKTVVGDAACFSDVEQACLLAGDHATIISTMGGKDANYLGHRNLIDCAEKHQIKRMLLVTSLGCGNSWDTLSDRAKLAFGQAVREKSLAESWLQTSTLDYLILRPGGLLDNAATGKAQCYPCTQEVHGYVNRQDLAQIMFDKLLAPSLGKTIYSVIEPELKAEKR